MKVTATAQALAPEAPQNGAGLIDPELPITPAEGWAMVGALKISLEPYKGLWIATFRNDESFVYLPVSGATPFEAVTELLAQLGVEVAHG